MVWWMWYGWCCCNRIVTVLIIRGRSVGDMSVYGFAYFLYFFIFPCYFLGVCIFLCTSNKFEERTSFIVHWMFRWFTICALEFSFIVWIGECALTIIVSVAALDASVGKPAVVAWMIKPLTVFALCYWWTFFHCPVDWLVLEAFYSEKFISFASWFELYDKVIPRGVGLAKVVLLDFFNY